MCRMQPVHLDRRSVPAALGIITVIAYGLLLPFIGFYWDDWPFAWIARFLGPAEFIPAFRGFRPFLGPIFYVTTNLLPPNPLVWQMAALAVRFAAAIAAWFALRQVWPRHGWQTSAAALLFLIYPGYSQHWVALTHINQEWIPLIAYLLSLGLGIQAARMRRPMLFVVTTTAAVVLEVVGLFPTEYFIGLEPLRLMFLWLVAGEFTRGFWKRLTRSLGFWWPYLIVWLANAFWLARYYGSGAYVSYDLTATAAPPQLSQAATMFADALWKAGLYVWVQILVLLGGAIRTPTSLGTLGLIAVSFLLAVLYLRQLTSSSSPETYNGDVPSGGDRTGQVATNHIDFALPALVIGAAGILLGRVPSFAAGLPLTLQSSFDRFMISMMLGGTLFVVGLVTLLFRNTAVRTYAVAALLALGIGQQFFNANIFRRDWQRQNDIYWQLAWRIPALEPNTAVVTTQVPLDYETDLSMTAALNWIYSDNPTPPHLPYAMVYSEKRLGGIVLPDLRPGTPMRLPFRTMEFTGDTSHVLVVYVPPDGCLRVMDPGRDDQQTYSRFPDALGALIPLSRPDLILPESGTASTPPIPPFAALPSRSWCYYYEKADLAGQLGDWQQVKSLEAAAAGQGMTPLDPFEWLPFIEADARLGNTAAAEAASRQALGEDARIQRGLCVVWSRVAAENRTDREADHMIAELGCGQ
jgi:hypothetical protein